MISEKKIDLHKNVKVNIFKTKNKFNDEQHKKEKGTYKNVPYWHCTSQKQCHLLGSNGNTWKDSWEHFRVEYTHHQLTVNAMFPNMTISENTTSNKTSLGKLLEDV